MQANKELGKLILHLYQKEANGNLFEFAKDLYSRQEGVSLIGSQ